jgi:para-nitrobenzyl esterase
MKRSLILLALVLATPARAELVLPRISPNATVTQSIGITDLTVKYSRPGVKDALEFGRSAPQTEPGTRRATSDLAVAGAGLGNEGEDCLVLNIWTPAVNDGRRRPVMLWCHGGGFSSGSGSSPVTQGANLARRGDVVVVTINHRLNVLGFTYLGETGGGELAKSGDVGMLDIVHALAGCVPTSHSLAAIEHRHHIGQSGGGRKGTLLAMPEAKGCFTGQSLKAGRPSNWLNQSGCARGF